MKILLLEPKYGHEGAMPWIPAGKAYLAAVLRKHGFEVRILDNALHGFSDEILAKQISDFAPQVVGTGGMTLQFKDTTRIARIARACLGPEVLLVGGGVHLTLVPEDGSGFFDVVVIGEAEETLLELCQQFEASGGRKSSDLFETIAGIAFFDDSGVMNRCSPRPFIEDLDKLPFPAYDLLDVPRYRDMLITGERAISILTGRGCPFDCDFCASPALYQRKVRYFSLDYTFRLIDYLVVTYGFKNLRIMDDTFSVNKKRVMEFCKRIQQSDYRLNMTCLTHVKTGDDEVFNAMKAAGFSIVALGLESGNDHVLKMINKGTNTDTAIKTISSIKQAGLFVEGLFMVGNKGETEESIIDTINFAKTYNPAYSGAKRIGYNWFQFATPFPGSRFFRDAIQHGTVISWDYDEYSHKVPVFIPKGMDKKRLIQLRERAMLECNYPSNVIYRTVKIFMEKVKYGVSLLKRSITPEKAQ